MDLSIQEIVQNKLYTLSLKADSTSVEMAIAETEQVILNYCNISKVPTALMFTHANMVVDLLRHELALAKELGGESKDLDDISLADVTSIKIGDTSINLGKGAQGSAAMQAANAHQVNLDTLVLNYQTQLQKFRKMVW